MPLEVEVHRRLLDAVEELASAAEAAQDAAASRRLLQLSDAIRQDSLRVAVVGEIGNGKSTLVNSLIGEALLPMGVAPVTRSAAIVRHGAAAQTSLVYTDGVSLQVPPDDLPGLAAEGVARLDRVEAESPAEILRDLTLVDLPGLGDADGVSLEAIDALVATADCALCVLNCDRLLSLTERSFIGERLLPSGAANIAFVLNRSDGKSEEEIAAVMDRARHLLEPLAPDAPILPYSALKTLQARLNGKAEIPPGYSALQALTTGWIGDKQAIQTRSAIQKIQGIAAALDASLKEQEEAAGRDLEICTAGLATAEADIARLQDQWDAASRRAHSGLDSVREQFLVGLKDFALKLRESVPQEIRYVPVDEARRFLPFFIQDSLKRAVDENDERLRAAMLNVLETLSGGVSDRLHSLMSSFQLDVEPPAIPLYVGRDRAPLSQGSSFVMGAAAALMLSEFYLGFVLLSGSLMSREIGKQLEAVDRRNNLATSAQTLVHGSIQSMEQSLDEQFKQLQTDVGSAIEETFAPQVAENQSRVESLRAERDAAAARHGRIIEAARETREHLDAALHLIAGLPPRPEAAETPGTKMQTEAAPGSGSKRRSPRRAKEDG